VRIVNAELRRISAGDPPEPLAIAPRAIIAANATAARDAVKASPGDYEGCLVRFPARLLDTWDRAEGSLLSLATGDTKVTARIAAADYAKLQHIEPGSELLVTGIVELNWDFNPWAWPPRVPRGLELLIRSAGDVVVVRTPPWWTPRRLSLLLGGATALLAAALAWAWTLRREVTRQRSLVDLEMRCREEDQAAARDRERKAELRSLQELEAKLTTSLAAAAVAHEIKLPLSNLLLASRLAEEMLAPDGTGAGDIRPLLADIAAESGRVVTTIDRMRALLRNVQTEHATIDIANVVHNALLQANPMLEERGIDLETASLDASITVEGDAIQLQNAVANLLANAVDAVTPLPAERRRVRVAIESGGAGGGKTAAVEIVVGDAGPGLPLEVPAKLPLHTTKAAGSGLGLFIVRTAAVNHGGSVTFGRSPLGGAEVRLVLPVRGSTPGQ